MSKILSIILAIIVAAVVIVAVLVRKGWLIIAKGEGLRKSVTWQGPTAEFHNPVTVKTTERVA